MSKGIRLHDPKYPKEPTDVTLQDDGILLLEDEDGESVALSPAQVQQLLAWLASFSQVDALQQAHEKLQEWNAWAAKKSDGLRDVPLNEYLTS